MPGLNITIGPNAPDLLKFRNRKKSYRLCKSLTGKMLRFLRLWFASA